MFLDLRKFLVAERMKFRRNFDWHQLKRDKATFNPSQNFFGQNKQLYPLNPLPKISNFKELKPDVQSKHIPLAKIWELLKVALSRFSWCQNFVLQFSSSLQPKRA